MFVSLRREEMAGKISVRMPALGAVVFDVKGKRKENYRDN